VDAFQVAEQSRQLLRSLNYRGFCAIEYKWDARDGTYRLMEINPRTASGNQLAIDAGVDFPWIGYRYLTGTLDQEDTPIGFRRGVKLVNEGWDVQAYLALRKTEKLSFWKWLASLRGAKPAIWAWNDPLPSLVGLGVFLRRLAAKLRPSRRTQRYRKL
jgi:predicted ATP-grasp superfamily ATP-dependent carboligase